MPKTYQTTKGRAIRTRRWPSAKLVACLVIFFCLAATAQEQQTPFVLQVNSRLVTETVSVKDKDGKPIEGLTAKDFVVTEDGVPQTISVFEFEKINDAPLPAPVPRPNVTVDGGPAQPPALKRIEPGPPGQIRYQDRRLLALYFDMGSMSDADRYRTLSAALKFIETQMTAADLVSIMTYSDGVVRVKQDFTDNRTALEGTIEALLNGDDPNESTDTDVFGQNAGEFNIFSSDRQLSALQTAVQMMSGLNEKKSLIYFAGGLNLNVENQAQLRATLNSAIRANVAFYPVDTRGLVASAPMGNASQRSPGGIGMYTGATAMASMRGFQRSQDALYTLAADTGGKALLDNNDLSQGIVRAQKETASYYVIGYNPTNTANDGKLRRIKITLKDREAKLSYREAYYANKEFSKFTAADKERQLEEALMLGNPITDLTIALEVNYFQLNSAEYFVPLAVKIPGSELLLAQKAKADRTVIDFIGEIKDEYGTTITNIRDKVEINLKGETASQLSTNPIQYDAGFTVLPGNYIIKFLARNAETGRIGTYQADFVVPNLNKELLRLPISSVVLSNQRVLMDDALFNAGKDKAARAQVTNPLVEDNQKLVPSVTRVFAKNRDMYVYLQAYEREATTTRPLVAFVTFYRGQDKVFESSPFGITSGLNVKSKAVPLKLTVSLKDIPTGEYVCQVTVLDPDSQKIAFWNTSVAIVQ